jgi:hypothetical protein
MGLSLLVCNSPDWSSGAPEGVRREHFFGLWSAGASDQSSGAPNQLHINGVLKG